MTSTTIARTGFLRSRIGGLPRPFWALFGGTLVNRLGTMVDPFIGVYLTQSRGMSLAATGLVLTVYGAGSLASQPVAGWMADRFGRRVTLAGSMLLTAVAFIALGYTTSIPGIVVGMFVLGIVIDAYRPASHALVADLVSPEDRPRAYGLIYWALNLGFSVAMIAGGWLAKGGFTTLFWIDAITCAAFAVLVWRAIPETRPAKSEVSEGGFGDVLRDRLMVAFTLVNLVYAFVYLQGFTTLPLAMAGQGLPTSAYGSAMAVNGVLIVVIQPLTNAWLAHRDPSRLLALGFVVVGGGFALTTLMSSALGHGAAIAVWTLGEIALAGIPGTIVAALAPPHLRGRYAGLNGFAWSAASLLAPLLGTRLLDVGAPVLWITCGVLGALAAAAMLAIAPAIRRRAGAEAPLPT
ncbi:MDR family MFS transporter [Microtetraspora malaysiensis]|uniref:MDR family MFS transporter n=1 Tax=Microtetraspora malaysiensis TaxID=161358 RepID=UPI000836D5B9|nr:MFS transporter [Microtetraspora malaysiensis]